MSKQPSSDLYNKIISKINKEHKLLILKRRIFLYSFVFLLSLAAIIPLSISVYTEAVQSGSAQFLSLLFTDFKAIISYFNDYILSVVESLPITSIAVTSLISIVLCSSLRKLILAIGEMRNLIRSAA